MSHLTTNFIPSKQADRGRDTDAEGAALLQRKCACGKHTTDQHGQCTECKKKGQLLQRRAVNQNGPEVAPPIVHEVLRSPGRPLDPTTRAYMEPRFSHDFSGVRIHTDAKAAESARAVNALAYTVGNDIVFGEGQFTPRLSRGKKLLGHELTHVIQQQGASFQKPLPISGHHERHEREAAQAAKQIVHGQTVVEPSRKTILTLSRNGGPIMSGIRQEPVPTRRTSTPSQAVASTQRCSFRLCFLPLQVLLDLGVEPALAYATANHAFIEWNGHSVGFTRLEGEDKADARVISPEPRAGESHKRCVSARFRTIPSPTPGQLIHFSSLDRVGDLLSYGVDVVQGIQHCQDPSCSLAQERIQRMIMDDRQGLYDLFDENCETWARNILAAACLQAPEIRLGGIGNQLVRILNETTPGRFYHYYRRIVGATRPMPDPD